MKKIAYPPRLDIAHLPTPIKPLARFGKKLGVELYIKHDDLTGIGLTGNKVRKLEFSFADALAKGADTVLTCGGAQSNHSRATAIVAAVLGLRCRLLLRTQDPANPPPPEGNILLDRMAGAEIVWITPAEYADRAAIFEREAESLRREGRTPYIIPEGASNPVGTWGYIRAAEELAADIEKLPGGPGRPTTVIHATGSGGTAAGLILGARLTGLAARLVSFNVCDDRAYFLRAIGEICERTIEEYRLDIDFDRERDIDVIDGYVGRGYALSSPEELSLYCEVARTEGVFLDPSYTGKAFYGMVRELERCPGCFGERIVFIHTGGIFALFPKAAEIAPLL
ncbi:MAG: D-cysteine desulfhydrase family protein [Syntrophobacteraceae bacterium]